MKHQFPVISVVMSAYNAQEYLAAAIESVLGQTFRDFEFIIINDGSRDATGEIARSYAAQDARIRLIEQDNTGLTVALRRGVDLARGEFIARMDADDISMPSRLEKQIAFLNANPDFVAVSCIMDHFWKEEETGWFDWPFKASEIVPLLNCFSNAVGGHGQVVFRRSAYDAAGGYDPSFRYAQDYDLWTRLTEHGKFGIVKEMLYRIRQGHDNISAIYADEQAECSLRTCRRQYQKLTGNDLDDTTVLGLRYFMWGAVDRRISFRDLVRVSAVIAKGINTFFANNPGLRRYRHLVERSIARGWWLRTAGDETVVLRPLLYALTGYWGGRTLRASVGSQPRQSS